MSEQYHRKTNEINIIIVTDVGSTTTKARLFQKINNEFRFICTGEAPTTVEAPFEDVTIGVQNAVREIEEKKTMKILDKNGIHVRSSLNDYGVDLYVTTSSAGGGLQMMVFGVTKTITAESAERAALGAGSIVMDVITVDDSEPTFAKVEKTRFLRPDMVLIAGGTDGQSIIPVTQAVEILAIAQPKARFGEEFKLPVVYAGNINARNAIQNILGEKYALEIVPNIRPTIELEQSEPARDAIHRLFMNHVMSHAPGYTKLMEWTDVPIMPTPMGEGMMCQTIARINKCNVIGVGLGGATTNIYSVFDERFVRTVSANLGMSYSICNVLKEAKINNISRWIPFEISEREIINILTNKMIRPTTIPHTLKDLMIEHSVAREAIRLGFNHHKFLARPLRGVVPVHDVSKILEIVVEGLKTYIDMMKINLIAGTGGLLSHAPRRVQGMMIMIDAFQPEGITTLVQDSVFMMPHLGILSTVEPEIAMNILEKDCLINLGTCISPKGISENKGEEIMSIEIKMGNGNVIKDTYILGDIKKIPIKPDEKVNIKIMPNKKYDVGLGNGKSVETTIKGGVVGVIIDARGRPLTFQENLNERKNYLKKLFKELEMYPNQEEVI